MTFIHNPQVKGKQICAYDDHLFDGLHLGRKDTEGQNGEHVSTNSYQLYCKKCGTLGVIVGGSMTGEPQYEIRAENET